VALFHGAQAADDAMERFRTVFQRRELPDHVPELKLAQPISVIDILTDAGLVAIRSERRRLAQQGGLRPKSAQVHDTARMIEPDGEHILQVGRRKLIRLLPGLTN
jgi:tyrosyl-tRNA synthetase